LPEGQYREILGYEMPPENMNYIPVWTIRSPKPRPDRKLKTEFLEWKDLPALDEKTRRSGAELGLQLGVKDINGLSPVSYRDTLGNPPELHASLKG
jgi:hypothetical protein